LHVAVTLLHVVGVALLLFALFLDAVSILRWVRFTKVQDDTPGYGCFPLAVYWLASILIGGSWNTRISSMIMFTGLHVGYQMTLMCFRIRRDRKSGGRSEND